MRDYTALLEAGNKAQLEKLEQNGHKKGFQDVSISGAFDRLRDESYELEDELFNTMDVKGCSMKFWKQKINIKAVRHEAADIANFAHMIILACDKELEK